MTILDSWNDLRPKSNIRCTLKMHSDLVTSLAAALAQRSEDVGSNDEVRVRFPVDAFQEKFEKLIFRFQVSVAQIITRHHGASLRCPQIQSNSDGEFWDRNPGSPQLKFFLHHF